MCLYLKFFLIRIFPHSGWIRNRKSLNTDTFYVVYVSPIIDREKKDYLGSLSTSGIGEDRSEL